MIKKTDFVEWLQYITWDEVEIPYDFLDILHQRNAAIYSCEGTNSVIFKTLDNKVIGISRDYDKTKWLLTQIEPLWPHIPQVELISMAPKFYMYEMDFIDVIGWCKYNQVQREIYRALEKFELRWGKKDSPQALLNGLKYSKNYFSGSLTKALKIIFEGAIEHNLKGGIDISTNNIGWVDNEAVLVDTWSFYNST